MEETPVEATQKYVNDLTWPASKEEVVAAVERNGAPDDVVQTLRGVDKERFAGPNEVHMELWRMA